MIHRPFTVDSCSLRKQHDHSGMIV
ncbi:hypothetical protein NPIL_592031, partial [Nephila pilipes]